MYGQQMSPGGQQQTQQTNQQAGGQQMQATPIINQGASGGQQGYNPLQPTYAGAPTMSNVNLDPNATIQQILAAFQPQAASANQNFMDTMALSGLSGGPVQSGEAQLQGQLAAGLAPELGSAIQGSQGMELQQALANAGAWNQNSMFNAGLGTQAGDQLAQMLYGGWGQQLGQVGNILGTGQQGFNNIAGQQAQNFGVQAPIDWASLAAMFGGG